MAVLLKNDTSVGFVGLGNLGHGMALNLLDRGWSLTVFDSSTRRADILATSGASTASTIQSLHRCSVICLAVPDDAAVTAILLGKDGLLPLLDPGQTVIVHSTVLPETARMLARAFGEAGVAFLDAPVSGGPDRARRGELTLMVGGAESDLAAVETLVQDMASEVLHQGPAGSGSATKLANQLMMFSTLAGTHEALRLGAAYGVPPAKVLQAVSSSTGDSWIARNWGFFDDVAADYNRSGTPGPQRPWSKDLWEVVLAARQAEIAVPLAGVLAQILPALVEEHADPSRHPAAAAGAETWR